MTPDLVAIAMNLGAATVCGALIGTERQARQRMAGVRTNALVALGAASFVTFASLFPNEPSQTRVAAQIVSGVGFLGAGIIFRDGLNVLGLNTAATLWCAAAAGMICGTGYLPLAGVLVAIVLAINLGLRPLVNWVDATFLAGAPVQRRFRIEVCAGLGQGEALRARLLAALRGASLPLVALTETRGADGGAQMVADVAGVVVSEAAVAGLVAALAAEGAQRVAFVRVQDE